MTETQRTMTEFTYATGETDVTGDRFSPSVVLFWLKTSVAASNMRVMYKSPNTLLGVIPLGSSTQTIPLRNIASVDQHQVQPRIVRLGRRVPRRGPRVPVGQRDARDPVPPARGSNLANTMSAQLDFVNQAGGRNSVKVSILEKDKFMQLEQKIQQLVFATWRDSATGRAWTWRRSSTRPRLTAC
mgnify:CR=1 FL=1